MKHLQIINSETAKFKYCPYIVMIAMDYPNNIRRHINNTQKILASSYAL